MTLVFRFFTALPEQVARRILIAADPMQYFVAATGNNTCDSRNLISPFARRKP
jgi:hypothetical protein